MSVVIDAIAQGKREIALQERRMAEALISEYGIAWRRIERELAVLDAQIIQAISEHGIVDEGWLSRQRWWQETQRSIDVEMARWESEAGRIVTSGQAGGVTIAADVTGTIARAAGSPFTGRVYSQAFERWVSAIHPGSPIRDVINSYGGNVKESALRNVTKGIVAGLALRSIVRSIMQEVGNDAVEYRLQTLARTEIHRSLRGASGDMYAPMQSEGIITGYRWLSARDTRVCIACLAMDGTVSKDFPMNQHVACRCAAIPVISDEYMPNQPPPLQSGEALFAQRSPDVQRKMLLSDARYEAYRDGVPLSAMVTTRHSRVWGDSIGIKPMRDIQP